ncbi:MAG: hypothetical protein GY951_08960 [Psychromonas sp.]|nr:hypothetical protein [Psychromonas sp.]
MKNIIILIMIVFNNVALASSSDSGVIKQLYVSSSGNIAVKLINGFPNSVAASECSTYNGWAGSTTADPALKSVLLAAKATGSNVSLVISGCDANNSWLKVHAVYVK